MIKLFKKNKKAKGLSFFDYSSTEKKKIIKRAAINSNKMQLSLIKQYQQRYN